MTDTGSGLNGGTRPSIWRYDSVAMALHWIIAVFIIVNLAVGLFADAVEHRYGFSMIPGHKSIGITVLVLSIIRLGWRLTHRPPPLPGDTPVWERATAALVHWAFYFFIIAMPLSGWIFSSAGKYPIDWFGLFPIAKLPVQKGSPAAGFSHEAHEIMGWMLLALVVLHVAAALRHRFILRDDVTRRMGLP